jgi:ribosomal-protein-alanine N-acetyltransferase
MSSIETDREFPMPYQFVPMTDEHTKTIADWRYDGVYAFYDFTQDPEDLAELLDSRGREGRYYAVLDDDRELAGFFCFERLGDSVELGLGLRPGDTGKGLGSGFARAGLVFARQRFHPRQFRLQVATFNQRAIRVYEELSFRVEKTFLKRTNGGEYDFYPWCGKPIHRNRFPVRPRSS